MKDTVYYSIAIFQLFTQQEDPSYLPFWNNSFLEGIIPSSLSTVVKIKTDLSLSPKDGQEHEMQFWSMEQEGLPEDLQESPRSVGKLCKAEKLFV